MEPSILLVGLVMLVGIILIVRNFAAPSKSKGYTPNKSGGSSRRQEKHQFAALVRMSRGDEGRARRLIEHERQRNPDMNRMQCIKAAIERLEADRR